MSITSKTESRVAMTGETNPVGDIHALLSELHTDITVELADTRLVRIERLCLVGWTREFPFWDISYCYGRLADGRLVHVDLGVSRIKTQWAAHLTDLCRDAKRYGKALGICDSVSALRG